MDPSIGHDSARLPACAYVLITLEIRPLLARHALPMGRTGRQLCAADLKCRVASEEMLLGRVVASPEMLPVKGVRP